MIRPRWEWTLEDAAGDALDASLSPVFTTQYDAEQWLGEHWSHLAGHGAARAKLVNDGRQVTPTVELPAP
ncbi:hypothetical protein ACNHYB_01600 [Isoptericola jiangsuensis]|uniref:hypothetical protein n=1 Tax=Isoptericola jiangsuensis TaxID=548579 RepID=UPI003AAE0C19